MMKKYLLPFLGSIILTAGCMGSKTAATVAPAAPIGTFTGKFARYHINAAHTGYDSVTSTVTLVMTGSPKYTYKITGDTSIHAGSHGNFGYTTTYFQFN